MFTYVQDMAYGSFKSQMNSNFSQVIALFIVFIVLLFFLSVVTLVKMVS